MIDITQWRIAIGTHHLRWRRNSNYGLTTLGEYHVDRLMFFITLSVKVFINKQGNDRHNAMENSNRYSSPPVEA